MPRAFKASNGRKEYCAIQLPGGGRKWVWGKTKREAEDKAIEEERLLGLGLEIDASHCREIWPKTFFEPSFAEQSVR